MTFVRSAIRLFLAAALSLAALEGRAAIFPVICGDIPVGIVQVHPGVGPESGNVGEEGAFVAVGSSLPLAALACGEHHFNWFQVVTADPRPPRPNLTPPYVDPPPGGYDYAWSDNLPWYFNESEPNPPLPGNFYPEFGLAAQTTLDTLNFKDFPDAPAPGNVLSFSTWLVSLNADGSLHSVHGGFDWSVVNVGPLPPFSTEPVFQGAFPTPMEFAVLTAVFVPEPPPLLLIMALLLALVATRSKSPLRYKV